MSRTVFEPVGLTQEQGPREEQQDTARVQILANRLLAAVADGMGGEHHGRQASQAAIQGLFAGEEDLPFSERARRAAVAVRRAQDQNVRRLGTTLSAVEVYRPPSGEFALDEARPCGSVTWIHVGDSRIYKVSQRTGIQCLTADHTTVGQAVEAGKMTREEARISPYRNSLTRYLGGDVDPYGTIFDAGVIPLLPGEAVVLASDGIWEPLGDSVMEEALRFPPVRAAERLMNAAFKKGLRDNATIVVVRMKKEPG